jgi:RTX calcium-binding nonapeptide repeat (4 copies)
VAMLAFLALSGTAHAQSATSCRASAARATVGTTVIAEPIVANAPASPCSTQHGELAGVAPLGGLSVSLPRASTRRDDGVIAAAAGVASASLGGALPISVGAVHVTQISSCQDGRTVTSGSSSVEALTIGGTAVSVIGGRTLDHSVLGVRIRTNQLVGDTRRALVLDIAGTEVVLGEATASGDACRSTAVGGPAGSEGSGGPGGGATSSQICPRGARYRVDDNVCVIDVRSATGAVERTIVVGRPYSGPDGGTLMSLSEARALVAAGRLADSACLRGKGPDYVVLGGSGSDRITGSNGDDRILGVGGADRIGGGRGDDCIDGGTRSDVLSGSEGADRILGGAGNDHLDGGTGKDTLSAGVGNDTVNTAFGADTVSGGPGRDAINAATAGPAARISGGAGRDTARANRNERRRIHGVEVVHFVR